MNSGSSWVAWLIMLAAAISWGGKTRLILELREPLEAGQTLVDLPAVSDADGGVRDIQAEIWLGESFAASEKSVKKESQEDVLQLNVATLGRNRIQVHVNLVEAANIEILIMDVYGKVLTSLYAGAAGKGSLDLEPQLNHESEGQGGLRFLALRLNGKLALKRVLTRVK